MTAVLLRYAADASEADQLELVTSLHAAELVLARACSAGNEKAWNDFLIRFRPALFESAYRIARDEATGRELAGGLYADLFGIPNIKGVRISKFDYYMGRGSLEGWLRSVLSQQYIDRYRRQRNDVSLDEQIEAGVNFSDPPTERVDTVHPNVVEAVAGCLTELRPEERFLLASYYLDERTLADIGRQLQVHESTISRKLERLTKEMHKKLRRRLISSGLNNRQCDELLQDLDVRDLQIDVGANLRQEVKSGAFYRKMDK